MNILEQQTVFPISKSSRLLNHTLFIQALGSFDGSLRNSEMESSRDKHAKAGSACDPIGYE